MAITIRPSIPTTVQLGITPTIQYNHITLSKSFSAINFIIFHLSAITTGKMTTYKLTLNIEDPTILQGWKFCIAHAMGSSDSSAPVGPDPGAPVGGFLFHTDKKLSAIVYQDSTSSPIYISPTPDPPHSGEELVPKESVALFFSKKLETKTMFSTVRLFMAATVDPFYLNYTGKTAHVVTYTKDGNWTVVQADRSGECDVEVPPHRETNGDGLPNGPAKRYRKKVVEITEEYD
ncbi:hypothetical protein Dda_5060 [Drechslerella dactyloides]|uniref:Uncharacterized protein n=1 Tax=Drechslerella dactyloides TaxID=74499 RepID=A0AAD6NL78_DREDA|nr:hypothetical protein Dda_5060 [Drechslerella dactyloides]